MLNAWAVLWITESCPQTWREIADVWGWCYLISVTWNHISVKIAVSACFEKVTKNISADEVFHKKCIPFKTLYVSLLLWKRGYLCWHRQKAPTTSPKDISTPIITNLHLHQKCICTLCCSTKGISLSLNRTWLRHWDSYSRISVFHVPVGSYFNVLR